MTGIRYLACLGALFITHTGFVCSDIQFFERDEGGSVLLPCAVEGKNNTPFGVYLKISWLHPRQVLFKYTQSDVSVDNEDDMKRISVTGDPSSHSLNVTISHLSARDTGHYYCEFMVNKPGSEDLRIRGRTEFFLLVNAGGQCGCSNYSSLLYALSSAVGILLLLLILGFVASYKGKARRSGKSPPQAPIYEEMTATSRKLHPRHLEEIDSSEYTNGLVKKSCPENHYESPSGALSTRSEAQK